MNLSIWYGPIQLQHKLSHPSIKHPIFPTFTKRTAGSYLSTTCQYLLLLLIYMKLERILWKQLVAYLETNEILCNNQHGFRDLVKVTWHNSSVVKHFDDIINALMNGEDADSIYLDFAKAFDKVDHKFATSKTSPLQDSPKINQLDSILFGWPNPNSTSRWPHVTTCLDNKRCSTGNRSWSHPVFNFHQ